ncbi:hypothetical protein OB236_38230 [Paenibacillus sp. WQ 127069]|uniref:Uncharacterized protein n=1 Tax=Paenibacillus baimaensis TaxID=2982185 RepID=A0ABT2UTJ4_9BACL|nr:hypothetical protein [Paenibacillus sp. WQ 127069]MCU6797980.1 hypothetical protein [Paenibacillus sp. WQ 127069]
MKNEKFSSLEEAQSFMEERGKLKYWGREGTDCSDYVYTLTIGIVVYHILLHKNGTLRVMDKTYL